MSRCACELLSIIVLKGRALMLESSEFFQLDPSFPTSNLFVRNGDGKALRSIYLTTSNIRDIINRNDYARMRLVSCGVKIFARQDAGNTGIYRCRWRVLQDGLSIMNAYIGSRRRIKTTLKALRGMLADQYPPIESFEEYQFKEDIKALENGSCICEILAGEEAGGKSVWSKDQISQRCQTDPFSLQTTD